MLFRPLIMFLYVLLEIALYFVTISYSAVCVCVACSPTCTVDYCLFCGF